MRTPYFSIVIPTRGRPDLLRDALVSALFQDFDDYEVVVSDNCNDDRTQQVLDEFRGYRRLRCIRPERLLSMPEHWEFASRHAEGTYVMFLTDRSVLKRHALKTIHGAISAADTNVQVCSWRWSSYDDVARCELDDIPAYNNSSAQMLSSQLIVEDFVEGKKYCYSLPRALNSCYRKDLVTSLRERYGTFFRPISPDYTSAFLLLANINAVLYIDQGLFISQGLSLSNGGNAYVKTGAAYLQTLGDRDWFPHVPIKSPLVENSIFQDYLSIRDLAGGTLSKVDINWPVYFEKCYRELIVKTGMGLLSAEEIKGLYAEWSKALAGFDHSVQDEVSRRIKGLRWVKLKERLRGSAIGPIVFRLRRKVDCVWHRGWQAVRGQSVLEAAGFRGEF
jgi:glycosyltransferase involved in cell wall biosynthesis